MSKLKTAIDLIKKEENNKNFSKGGWDKEKKRWFPHSSIEGGADTLAYGMKLDKSYSKEEKRRFYREGISDTEAEQMVEKYANKKLAAISKAVGKDITKELNPNQLGAMLSYVHNAGFNSKWSFVKSLKKGLNTTDSVERKKYLLDASKRMHINTVGGKPNAALTNRRRKEQALFATPFYKDDLDESFHKDFGEQNYEIADVFNPIAGIEEEEQVQTLEDPSLAMSTNETKPYKEFEPNDFMAFIKNLSEQPLIKTESPIEQEVEAAVEQPKIKQSPFKQAFNTAREAGEDEFEFNGNRYNTLKKGETKASRKAARTAQPEISEEVAEREVASTPSTLGGNSDFQRKIEALGALDPKSDVFKNNIQSILDNDLSKFIPEMNKDTPRIAFTGDASEFTPKQSRVVNDDVSEIQIPEEQMHSTPRADLGAKPVEVGTTLSQDIEDFTFEGMGDDLVNKFVDRNAVGLITKAAMSAFIQQNDVDPNFNIREQDKELYTQMTEGLEAEDIVDILDSSHNRGDFIKNASFARGKMERSKEMREYSEKSPVLSGVNTVGNILAEGAVFMPVSTLVSSAGASTKIKTIADLNKSMTGRFIFGEVAEQGMQELAWAKFDREYEFDPLLFATSIGAGVGLKSIVGTPQADAALRKLMKNEGGFINIATKEGRKLVDEVTANISDNKAIAFAKRITKKKVHEANNIRKNLAATRKSITRRLSTLDKKISVVKDKDMLKQLKSTRQKLTRRLTKFDKSLPTELKMLLRGDHPKLTAAVNPEFKMTNIAKELGIDPKSVSTIEKARKFLGLDGANVNPDFIFEGEKKYHSVVREQLKEMAYNKRLNMNETLRTMAGSDIVKSIDEAPLIGKLQIGDKLTALANTDGPASRFLFNKANLVSSDNEMTGSFYNWMSSDGMGRQGASKIRAIESQQKYSNIYGGELMNLYHTHGGRIFDAIDGKTSRVKGMLSPDLYEETVEPILKERLLNGKGFRAKYGDEIADAADDFYNDFNALNKRIIDKAKELEVEGVDFDATEGWFHRSWDYTKARATDITDLNDTIYRAMRSHADKLGIKNIDDVELRAHAKRFAYGIRNADISTIEAMQSDHIKLLEKLLGKSDGAEAKVIKDEITRLKVLQAKADAGDLANRVQMDVNVKLDDGRPLSDLFEDNVINTQKRYTARMSARIAAAEHGVKNIDDLDDWVAEAVELEVKRLAKKGVKNPKQGADFMKKAMEQDLMSFKHGGMVGLHDLPDDTANAFIRLVKKFNFARLMQYTGVSSISELGGTLVEAGVSTTLGEMGRYMRQHFNDLWIDSPDKYTGRLYDELRTIVGVGMEDFSFSTKGMSKANRVTTSGLANAFEKGVDVLGRVAQAPFGGIEKVGRRITVNSLAIKWANHFNETETGGILSAFFGSNGVTNRVLENSNFGVVDNLGKFTANDNYKNIKKSIKEFASFDDSGRLVKLNLEKWDNKIAHQFGDAIQMQANHIMVSPDSTTMALWQSSTVGQILNQFRSFTVNATTKVMGASLSNAAISANRGDTSEMIKAGQKIFWGTSLGMMSVALRQGIQRAGGDKEVDLFDEGLIKAAAIGFSRSSVAGNLPAISDSISGMFGYDPVFEKTSSTGRSQNFFNLATTPTGQAIGGVYQSIEKGAQGDFKGAGMKLLKTSPVYRQIGAQQIFNFIDDEK